MTPIVFCELIEDLPDITFLRDKNENGISAKVYMGKKGLPVIVDITDSEDEVDYPEGRGYLFELGYEELMDVMFPIPVMATPPPTIDDEGNLVEVILPSNEKKK